MGVPSDVETVQKGLTEKWDELLSMRFGDEKENINSILKVA